MADARDFYEDFEFFEECFKHCKQHINTKTFEGDTPIHIAARKGQLKNLQYLVEHGGDVNAANDKGTTPLHAAVAGSEDTALETVKYLMEHVSDINVKDKDNLTPIMHAVEANNSTYRMAYLGAEKKKVHLEILNYLMEQGVDTSHRSGSDDYKASLMRLCRHYNDIGDLYDPIIEKLDRKLDESIERLRKESLELVTDSEKGD